MLAKLTIFHLPFNFKLTRNFKFKFTRNFQFKLTRKLTIFVDYGIFPFFRQEHKLVVLSVR